MVKLTTFEKVAIGWLTLSGWVHIVMEGTFSWNNRTIMTAKPDFYQNSWQDYSTFNINGTHTSIIHETQHVALEFLKSLWKEYTCADSRYATSDPFVVSMETVTAWLDGPLCFLVLYGTLTKKPWRFFLQTILSVCQLYGLGIYFATEHLMNYEHCEDSIKCLYFYYWFFNLLWFLFPVLLLIHAGIGISNAESNLEKKGQKPDRYSLSFALFLFLIIPISSAFGFSLIIFSKVVVQNVF